MTLTVGSLFSGIGGADKGLEDAGMRVLWQVEIDLACNRVLERHWPEVRRYGDVREVRGSELEPVDVIVGGFPCQDLSVAGQRRGLAGERSGLWFEFHRILAERRPGWVIVENVPGLLSACGGADFACILRGLVELGYGVCWRILDLQHFGIPQRRRRVFIVGHLGGGRAAQVLFESKGGGWHPAPSRKAGARVASTVTSGVGVTGNAPGRRREDDVNLVTATLNSGGNNGGFRTEPGEHLVCLNDQGGGRMDITEEQVNTLRRDTKGHVPLVVQGGAQQDQFCDPNGVVPTLAHSSNSHQGHHQPKVVLPFDPTQITSPGNYSNPKEGDPCHPLAARQHAPAIASAMAARRLTPRECERLQSFPDDWTAGESDSARYRMLGNAIPPIIAEWIGKQLSSVALRGHR